MRNLGIAAIIGGAAYLVTCLPGINTLVALVLGGIVYVAVAVVCTRRLRPDYYDYAVARVKKIAHHGG